jgi:hypothetical protein
VREPFERIFHTGRPLLIGVLVGLAAGGTWTLVQADRYRAEARLLLRGSGVSRVEPAVRALGEGSILEQNVAQTLHLSKPPHVTAATGAGGVLTLSVEAGSRERARQIDAEAAQVLTQLVQTRFGTNPAVQASILDPAHPVGQTSPTPGRNLLIAGLIGLGLGAAAAAASAQGRREPAVAGQVDPDQERRLRRRIDEVTKRERALAKRAGELAARERASEERIREVEARETAVEQQAGELVGRNQALEQQAADVAGRAETVEQQAADLAARAQELEEEAVTLAEAAVEPEPVSAPVPAASGTPLSAPTGTWTMDELERFVRDRRGSFPERSEEWDTYLFLLRDHAGIDGTLPRSFDLLIEDVFGDALD